MRTAQYLLLLALVTACGVQPPPSAEPGIQDTPRQVQQNPAPAIEPLAPTATSLSAAPAAAALETAGPNCQGDEINPLGQSIAQEYEFTSYEQVMTWYCKGAEFEDILAALETESQTGSPAGEMLKMLAAGATWDEIWQSIGLTE